LLGSASLTGGALTLGGDLYGSGEVRVSSLTLNGLIRQRMEGTNVHTGDLTLQNRSKGGILLVQKLSYSETYTPNGTALYNETNLVKETAK
jgi:hypothetical protein